MHKEENHGVDYGILRNIDLTGLIKRMKSFGVWDEGIDNMFVYALNNNSDHMFELFDDRVIEILIDHLLIQEEDRISWNHKIFSILTSYTHFSNIYNSQYIIKMATIAEILFHPEQHQNINYSIQAEKNLVISMSRYLEKTTNCQNILLNEPHTIYPIIRRFWSRKPSLAKLNFESSNSVPSLVFFFCEMIHNLYSSLEYSEIDEEDQINILKQIKKILYSFPNDEVLQEDQAKLIMILIDTLSKLFGHSLESNPELIVSYKKYFMKLAIWVDNFRENQKSCGKYRDVIVEYLRFIKIIYVSNIPEELETQVSEFYKSFFESHVGHMAYKLLRESDALLQNYTLQMLSSILMSTSMTVFMIDEYSPLLSSIFMGVEYFDFNEKKEALRCVINILKSGVANNEGNPALEIVELFSTNGISDMLAFYLYEYDDLNLNLEIAVGIDILLEAEKNQYQAKIDFWRKFIEAGGTLKMERILAESNNELLKHKVSNILEKVSENEHEQQEEQEEP